MGNSKIDSVDGGPAGEDALRGAALDGAEQKRSVAHTLQQKKRDPDAVLHLDDEDDTLYTDGLETEGENQTLADTHGANK
jgi:hypothetical protein